MSKNLPNREQILKILEENQCQENVVEHCIAVADYARDIAINLIKKGHEIDLELVETGALLHDIGRAKTHNVNHAIEGAKIAKAANLPESVIAIIKRHVGGGISPQEATKLGWQKDCYIPVTIEEKIVCYADKLFENSQKIPLEKTIKKLQKQKLNAAADRILKLHNEIWECLGR